MNEGYRISPQQKRVWFLQRASGSQPYRAECIVRINGSLEAPKLKAACREVVERHEILRSNFQCLPEMELPLQVIGEPFEPSIAEYDLRGWTNSAQQAGVASLVEELMKAAFDYQEEQLLRLTLVRLEEKLHLLMISLPALCADKVGLECLVREIGRCYEACLQGAELEDLPLQYADLAEWLNEPFESGEDDLRREWRKNLALPPFQYIELPFERRLPEKTNFAPSLLTLPMDPQISKGIEILVERHWDSPSVFFLACWQILLWRLTGLPDIVIGITCDGRDYPELKDVLGLFAGCLPISIHLDVNTSLSSLLKRNSELLQDVHSSHGHYPCGYIIETDAKSNAFFSINFDFEVRPPERHVGGLSLSIEECYTCLDRFKVKLKCVQTRETILIQLYYDSNRFSADDIRRLMESYHALLISALSSPESVITELDYLSEIQRRQLLIEFNNTGKDFPGSVCVHELFEKQVANRPDSISALFKECHLTYSELNRRSNQLAHYLRRYGVTPDELVALYLERSLELIVGMLGILKAGGAYLPLDPIFPKERVVMLLNDAEPSVMVSQGRLREGLKHQEIQIVCLDADWEDIARESHENPSNSMAADNLVYAIYTSGSTGRPKAVAIEHRSLANYVNGILERLNFQNGAVYATVSTFAADLGNTSIFPSLCSGGCLHVISADCATDPGSLSSYFVRHKIDCLKIVPSHLKSLISDQHFEWVLPCESLVLGGEACSWKMIDQIRNLKIAPRILNHYGPTEATVGVLTHEIDDDISSRLSTTLPLSSPIANTRIYLLSFDLSVVPICLPGQIYIGGACLARCYLNRPEATAEKFIPNPFGHENGARLYQAGDLARRLPGGGLELIGRIDRQVKIAGHRVELGEIEAILREHPAIKGVEVMAVGDETGEKRLAAYVVVQIKPRPTIRDLRDFLKGKLPESIIPSTFVLLDAFPLTPNGKLDRQALLKCEVGPSEEGRASQVGERGIVQELLEGIWGELLGLERVGANDNFFELGGHSLSAMRLCSRVQNLFSVELSLNRVFEAQTINGLTDILESAMRAGLDKKPSPAERVPRDRPLPVSFAQQRLWFLEQLEPNQAIYNIPIVIRLMGRLNGPALEQCLGVVMDRHEVLRTVFQTLDEYPVQIIRHGLSFITASVDVSWLDHEARESIAAQLAADEAQRPFDLSHGPMIRARLLRIEKGDQILLLTIHHIAFDAWSRDLLIREITKLYSAFQSGGPSPLSELPIQYADFAVRQRHLLQGEYLNNLISYWKRQLSPLPPRLDLPTYHGGLGKRTFGGALQSLTLSPVTGNNLAMIGRRQRVTLFMITLAALKILLYRYTAEVDIVVGTPISNRNQNEFEGLIGFFLNTLVLRTELDGNPNFCELLERVRKTALDAYTHQELPFERLVEELQPERDLKSTPIFQVMFIYQVATEQGLPRLPGLNLKQHEFDTRLARYELTFVITEKGRELTIALEYDRGLYDPNMITGILGHLRTLLDEITINLDRRLSGLSILSDRERHQLTIDWNDTQKDFPENVDINELIEIQVERMPDSIAVLFEDEQLSYEGLNQRANQLANYLKGAGVRSEVKVGIGIERSLAALVAWLGVLKAGGAYIPLDPAYPADRLSFILKDVRTSILLTQDSLVTRFSQNEIRMICLDTDWETIAGQSVNNLPREATADNTAYVIYTSGSTGTPKGVEICRRAVVNFLESMHRQLSLGEHDILFSVTSLSFDIAALELLLPLVIGGRVVIASREAVSSGIGLLTSLTESAASVMQGTPTVWQIMLESGWPGNKELKILCGGESLSQELASRLRDKSAQVWNLYGPTETTIWSTVLRTEAACGPVSIGRPIGNTEIYLLDATMNLMPAGVRGELHIGGVGLARGYYNRPELTAEKFIADPIGHNPGRRLYRTGDLGCYRPDGNVEFLGRSDGQVKIRGFRIELGEIEAVINSHPSVRQSVVLVREDQPGQKRIVAYIVPAQVPAPSVGELRRHLTVNLPEYMIPSAVIPLDKMPLTPNAKIDRRALPAPDDSRPLLEEEYVEPQTPTEQILANLFSELLGVKRIGIYDNFFDLGGHSILSIQVVARANQNGLRLTPKQVFNHPTIAQLALIAERTAAVETDQSPVTGEVDLTPIQLRFFERSPVEPNYYNYAVLLESTEVLMRAELAETVKRLLWRHDALRMRFENHTGTWRQFYSNPDAEVPIVDVDLSELDKTAQLGEMETITTQLQSSLNLSEGPILRIGLFNFGNGAPGRILWVIHHLVVDRVSWNILLEDLEKSYLQSMRGEKVALPSKTSSYQQWSERLREYAQADAELIVLEHYWSESYKRDVMRLPLDRVGGVNSVRSVRQVKIRLEPEQTDALLREVPKAYNTQINDVLLTALVQTLCEWTGGRRVSIGLEDHVKEGLFADLDLTRTVGCFTSHLPIRLELGLHQEGPGEALKTIKEQLRRVPMGGLGFNLLRYLRATTDIGGRLKCAPEPEVSFNYLGQLDQALGSSSLFRSARWRVWPSRSSSEKRGSILEIVGWVEGEALHFNWNYTEDFHDRATIEKVAQRYLTALRDIIGHCRLPWVGGYTPSDFPYAELSQAALDRVITAIATDEIMRQGSSPMSGKLK
jgi:amino acid adenylation domain-containing protein/non-ribosomal peptide synthase protein (TIGR01720 family)